MKLINADCIEAMKAMPENSVDSIVTDPPYELGFMGKSWDSSGIAFNVEVWQQALRVLKPGGHLIAFSGSRTYHRMAVAIEDAGFEIRDQIMWVYGSGFPKSMDISKQIDKQAGVWRGRAGKITSDNGSMSGGNYERTPKEPPYTDEAQQWQGWGTALKPAHEPMVLARKPLGSPALDIVQAIEYYLENNVLKGGIKWIQESARPATKKNHQTNSSSTNQQKTVEIFAETVATSGSEKLEKETLKSQNLLIKDGKSEIQTSLKNLERSSDCNCDQKSCKHTETSALAAQNLLNNSSPLITSVVAGANTEKQQVIFTQKSVKLDSRLTIESCVGTATPHSEFTAFVLTVICNGETYELSNNNEGLWTWPSDLPKKLPAQTMTVANNVLTYGVGGLNIDGSRVGTDEMVNPPANNVDGSGWGMRSNSDPTTATGRWPANVIHDGSDEVVDLLGEPARFFYCAKASKRDRNEGLDGFEAKFSPTMGDGIGGKEHNQETATKKLNHHPTVKPTSLMQYLVRLVTPPNGTVLDPFMGSGSTGKACAYEGFDFVGIDMTPEYVEIAKARIAYAQNEISKENKEG